MAKFLQKKSYVRVRKNSSCASASFVYQILLRVNRNVTNRTETPSESLITVSLPVKLHAEVLAFQQKAGLSTLSEVIRHALDSFDTTRPAIEPSESPHSHCPSSASRASECRAHRQGGASGVALKPNNDPKKGKNYGKKEGRC